MKKMIALSALIIAGAVTYAQKTTFGIKAGIQSTSLSAHASDDDNNHINIDGPKAGALLGGVADIKFTDKFSIQPNLLFLYKSSSLLFLGEGKMQMMSVDIPVNFLYHNNGFFIGAGPNFSYGISAKYKPFNDSEDDVNLYKKQGEDNAPFKRFEIGANAIMGYQFPSGLTVTTNFTRGFNNIGDKGAVGDDTNLYTKQFGISIGYMFNGGKAKK